MKSDVKIVEMDSPSKSEQEYHSGDVTVDELAKEQLGFDPNSGEFPPIAPIHQGWE